MPGQRRRTSGPKGLALGARSGYTKRMVPATLLAHVTTSPHLHDGGEVAALLGVLLVAAVGLGSALVRRARARRSSVARA